MRDRYAALLLASLLAACGGGGAGTAGPTSGPLPVALTAVDVERIVAQAAAEAQARAKPAHIVVVDRVGNVLASYHMTGAPDTVSIVSPFSSRGGLDGIAPGTIPAPLAAIAKAITGAYLSSNGNAFSTRTAGQIIEEHFDPQEAHQPGGPLYGVQFSQLTCSDVVRNQPTHATLGPKRSPLGLAADPGGLPLYKDGVLVGAIAAEADGIYTIDRDITDIDDAVEEHIAVAGSFGFTAPADIRGDRITADGRTFRFIDSEATMSDPSKPPPLASLPGALTAIAGYQASAAIAAGTPFGSAASGIRPGEGGWILVDGANANRYAPRASSDGSLSAADVQSLLNKAIAIAQRARGQIRRPLGSSAEVSIAVVDLNGDILGFLRTPDAPVFGVDVAVQKARTALFFSHPQAASDLASFTAVARYGPAFQSFLGTPASLTGGIAWTPRAIGNLHRPYFPDGIEGTGPGPLSTPFATWSPFNVGFQLDLVFDQVVKGVQGDLSEGCAGSIRRLRNGAQIFPGGVPIYGGANLVAAIGVSGDGVDQDDMVALLGVANWASAGRGNAPKAMRSDTLTPQGVRLRYAQCPQAPFNDSSDQNVCAGL